MVGKKKSFFIIGIFLCFYFMCLPTKVLADGWIASTQKEFETSNEQKVTTSSKDIITTEENITVIEETTVTDNDTKTSTESVVTTEEDITITEETIVTDNDTKTSTESVVTAEEDIMITEETIVTDNDTKTSTESVVTTKENTTVTEETIVTDNDIKTSTESITTTEEENTEEENATTDESSITTVTKSTTPAAVLNSNGISLMVSGDIPDPDLRTFSRSDYQDPQGRFRLEILEGNSTRFYNNVDGYSIVLSGLVAVRNMNLSGLCAVLTTSEGLQIEIYREDFLTAGDIDSYLVYSYQGVDNANADIKEQKTMERINGRDVQVYLWHRNKLNGIQNDRNYYTSLDIIDDLSVYNIVIKTERPISEYGGYESILDSFTVRSRTALGSNQITQAAVPHTWNDETQEFYREYFINEGIMTWGLFEPSAPMDLQPLRQKEAELGYTFPVLLYYSHIHKNYQDYPIDGVLAAAYEEGRTLELTLQTNSNYEAEEGNMVYQVLNGVYDDFLHQFAADVAAFEHPVMFRLGNEMNGDWCPYSAYHTSRDTSVYRAFYRYVYEIFRQEGALENTIWIWNPNERAYPNYKWNYETLYYPGNEYVDVIGLTGYNTGTYYASVGETWRSFTEIYDPIYKKVIAYSAKPMMITEFACSSIGGDKAAWVEEMFKSLKNYPKLKMAVWWDGRDMAANGDVARPYYINDGVKTVENFRNGLRGGYQ